MILMSVIAIIIYAIWLIREVRASINDTEKKANIDVLTGLPNRNRYEAYLKSLNGSSERLMCLFIDVNGLHELNNTKGHFAGDQMLRFIADTLKVLFSSEHIYRIEMNLLCSSPERPKKRSKNVLVHSMIHWREMITTPLSENAFMRKI